MRTNRSMPPGAVIPELAYPDIAAASKWLCEAFGFSERLRIADHRIQLRVGAGAIVLITSPGTIDRSACSAHAVMVRVEDVDAHFGRAERAGARIINPPVTHPYGERQYTALDFAGHRWTFSESVEDIHPSQWGGLLVNDET